ncbi:hypothetical protein E4O04_00920 [Treponema sp. OMZ 799]|uniref:FlgD immunoglobulin-like domain containing protein n=1 Tax=Treponema sp. OMZ 799 TaxID=2563668 RepID=UPI0020A56093|nr:FlgD immunoglobulin-like domain containing protein [Treponema sp. OMZ 799]UTC76658.1 hypothetical protein E4O04_00920 [Treponema sp. OMZ 799]
MKKIQKTLFMLIYTLFVMTAGFAADFTWKVDATSSLWDDRDNWTYTGTLHSGHPGYPSNDDNATIVSSTNSPIITTSITINSLTITSGSLSISGVGNLTLSGNFTNNGGTFIANTGTVKLDSSGDDIQISGTTNTNDTQFHHLLMEVTNGTSKTLTIKNKIKINGDLSLKGSATDRFLVIKGSADIGSHEITLTANNTKEGYNLQVYDNIIITTRSYITNQSKPEPQTSSPSGWIFKDCTSLMTWTAGASSDADKTKWDNYDNWKPKGVPGINTPVKIPTSNKYPKLESTTYANAKTVTVEAGAEIDCDEYVVSSVKTTPPNSQTSPSSLDNFGTLKMKGTSLQESWFIKITLESGSTIEYYGNMNNAVWAGPYKNLSLNNRARLTINNQLLTVSQHLKVHNNHVIIDTGYGNQTYSGNISADEIPGTNPKKRYNIKFQTNGTVTTQHAVTAGDIHVTGNWKSDPVDNAPLNIASTGKIEVGGIWTAGSDSFTAQANINLKGSLSAGEFIHKKGTLTFNGNGTLQTLTFTNPAGQKNIRNLIVDNGSSSPASNAKVKLLSSVMIAENFTNKGAFNANNNDISLDGSFTNSGTFNTGTGNSLVFNSTFTNNGIFNADADTIVFSGNTFTNSGTFIAGANNTVNLSPSGDITITGTDTAGNTKFHTLKLINAGGKTLTVNGKITVDDLNISGTSSASKLTVEGSSPSDFNIELTSDQIPDPVSKKGYYLDVKRSVPINDGYIYYVAESGLDIPNPKNWQHMVCTWKTTATTTAWGNTANWTPEIIPTADWPVIIPAGAANYPILVADTSAQSVTVAQNAALDLGASVIKKGSVTAKLTNHGTIRLTGTNPQATWFGAGNDDKIDLKTGSTVVYYGAVPATSDIWSGPYENLKVSGGKKKLDAGNKNLEVNGEFTVEANTGAGFTVSANSQHYKDNVKLSKETTFISSGGTGTVFDTILQALSSNITFDGNGKVETRKAVTAQDIEVKSGNGLWTSGTDGTINARNITVNRSWTATNNIVASGDVNITGTWQSASVTASNITAHTWTSSGNVTSRGNITASDWTAKNVSLKGNLTAAQFNQTGGTLTFNGTGTPEQELKFTGATKNINNLTIDNGSSSPASNAKVKLLSSVMIAGDFTNKGTFDATSTGSPPGYTVTLTNNDHIINSSGTTNFHKLECTNAGGKTLTINGSITVDGDLNISGTAPNNYLNIKGPGKITLGDDQKPDSGTPPQRGYYLNIDTNIPITDGHTYTVTESKANEISGFPLSDGHPKNWIFLNCTDTKLTWNGSQSTDWGKFDPTVFTFSNDSYKNWSPWGIPGEKTEVIIPSNKPRYPKLENSTNAKAKSVAVNTGAELYLEDQIITLASGQKLTNGGKVYLKNVSTPAQSTWISNFVHNPGSTIVYKDVTNASNTIWQGPYRNLIFESTVPDTIQAPSLTVNETLTVNKNITINTTGAQSYNIIEASAKDLTFTAPSLTTSGNVNMNKINATGVSTWTASNGDIKLTGNLSASKFTQTGGKLTFNKGDGVTVQTLTLTNTASEVFSLEVSSSSILHLTTPITLISSFVNAGKFDALDQDVTLKPTGTISITGTTTQTDTKFGNLSCENAGEKTFKVKNKISVQGDLNLSGTPLTTKLLTIDTDSAAEIYLNKSFGSIADGGAKGAYLKINTDKVSIKDKKYYVVDKSVDHEGKLKNKNGWIFVKEGLKIENSFAKPNDDNIYLLFNNLYLTKEEFNTLGDGALTIEASGSTTYSSDLQTVDEITVPTIPTGHSLWKIKLKTRINPDDILNKNYKVMLKYFVTPANITKNYISDIGINIADPLKAFNSIVLYTFNANDEPGLATLDITIPTKKEATSDNVKLYFTSKGSTGRFWFPNTITPTPSNISSFADSLTGATEYLGTPEGGLLNFIIRATDPHLKKGMVGQFMYVYDGWLPCARLKDSNNILSFDVWNFNIAGVQKQKGGVSIFDNVVNPHKGQSAKIAAHLKKSGMLTIQIMTLDGNVVRTLARSHKNAGDHVYTWDGRNNGGNPVASGMYFVRIAGPEIDEVRKILVIK